MVNVGEYTMYGAHGLIFVWCLQSLLMISARRMHGTGENGLEDLGEFDAWLWLSFIQFVSGEFGARSYRVQAS